VLFVWSWSMSIWVPIMVCMRCKLTLREIWREWSGLSFPNVSAFGFNKVRDYATFSCCTVYVLRFGVALFAAQPRINLHVKCCCIRCGWHITT
jgi:hypothetical protein